MKSWGEILRAHITNPKYTEGDLMDITLHSVYKKNNRKEGCGSYTNLSDKEVLQLVKDNWDKRIQGDTEDCWLVPTNPADWFCPEIQMEDGDLMVGQWTTRPDVDGDVPVYHEYAMVDHTKKMRANSCSFVVYELTPNSYALVTVLASLKNDGTPPMNLATAFRNVFGLGGGSPIEKLKTADDKLEYLLESFMYWNVRGVAQPAPKELMDRIKESLK